MPLANLQQLAAAKHLKAEKADRKEFDGLVKLGRARLGDARRTELSPEGRFDLAYNAAHAFALAALRRVGYRSENRYLVFQCLAHTLDIAPEHWRVLALAHDRRNAAEYSGVFQHDERLLADVIRVAELVLAKVEETGPPK